MKSKLIKNFKNFLFQEKLFSSGDRLVVGISGGADSVCLIKLLLAVQSKFELKLHLVHINYHLRNKDADLDEVFVRKFAKKEGLTLDVIDYIKQSDGSSNLEEALRDFRYKKFEDIRKEGGFDWVVIAHHQGDQAETFLMNLFRGAGASGLKGMKIRDYETKVLRPLLNFTKEECINFLKDIEQVHVEDSTNKDNTFLRNRIRNELIPEIEEKYSSNFKSRISNTTRQLQEYLSIIEDVVEVVYNSIVSVESEDSVGLDITKYKDLKKEIKPLIFREMVKSIKGDLKNITQNNYVEFEKIIQSKKGKQQVMEIGEINIIRKGDVLIMKFSKNK